MEAASRGSEIYEIVLFIFTNQFKQNFELMKRAGFDEYHITGMVLIEYENTKNKKRKKNKKYVEIRMIYLPEKHVFFRQLYAKIL